MGAGRILYIKYQVSIAEILRWLSKLPVNLELKAVSCILRINDITQFLSSK